MLLQELKKVFASMTHFTKALTLSYHFCIFQLTTVNAEYALQGLDDEMTIYFSLPIMARYLRINIISSRARCRKFEIIGCLKEGK